MLRSDMSRQGKQTLFFFLILLIKNYNSNNKLPATFVNGYRAKFNKGKKILLTFCTLQLITKQLFLTFCVLQKTKLTNNPNPSVTYNV